jgi:nucleobase:cation symporter-1, NCS1 family
MPSAADSCRSGTLTTTGAVSPWSIEREGVHAIPDAERNGKPKALFWSWAAPGISVSCVTLGLLAAGQGLAWYYAALAATVGVVVSFLLVGAMGMAGQQSGAPTMVTSRAAFGFDGNKLPTLLSWIAHVGWETVNAVLAAFAARTVVHRLAPGASDAIVMASALAVVILTTVVAAVYGLQLILRAQKWLAIAMLTLITAFFLLSLGNMSLATTGSGGWGRFTAVATLCATATGLGWVFCAGDYTRYLPRHLGRYRTIGWVVLGGSMPTAVLVIFGTLLACGTPAMARAAVIDPIAAVTEHLPTWFLLPFLLLAILGFISGSTLDLYSSGLSLLALGVPMPRYIAVLIDAVLVAIGGTYMAFAAPGFFPSFQAFLMVTGVPMAAWTGIVLVDIWCRRRTGFDQGALEHPKGGYGRINPAGVSVLLTATTLGFGLVSSADPHFRLLFGFLLTPAARTGEFGTSGAGVMMAMAVGALGYAALWKITAIPKGMSTQTINVPAGWCGSQHIVSKGQQSALPPVASQDHEPILSGRAASDDREIQGDPR